MPPPDPTAAIAAAALLIVLTTVIAWWYATAPRPIPAGKVTQITVYPLKSARGVQVSSAVLDARGIAFDRLWMVVDEYGSFMSQRRAPRLALVEAALPQTHDEPLVLSAPMAAKPLRVPVVKHDSPSARVRVWDDRVDAIDQGDEAAAWLAAVLGVDGVRLVRMADSTERACSRKYSPRGSVTAFSDGFPLLLANESSLAELNRRLVARGKASIPMDRFRPNLVIGGTDEQDASSSFAEDAWSDVTLRGAKGDVAFGVVKPCARCKMPTINQVTGVPDGRGSAAATTGDDDDDEGGGPAVEAEPTATLRTFRSGRVLGYKKRGWAQDVFFGQNLVLHAAAGSVISVGDPVVATPRRAPGWFVRGVPGVDTLN